jgi:hypothetical protein
VDFLQLDLDGAEENILQQFPFSEYTFSLITIPAQQVRLRELLNQAGYEILKNLTESGQTLLAHGSSIAQLDLTVLGEPN